MYLSAYDTHAGMDYKLDRLKADLIQDYMEERLYHEGGRIFFIDERLKDHRPFAHPLLIDLSDTSNKTEQIIVADVRESARYKRDQGVLKGGVDFEFTRARCHLMDVGWIDGNARDLINISDLSGRVFAYLIGELLTRKLGLEAEQQRHIQAIGGVYYTLLHSNNEILQGLDRDEKAYMGVLRRASRITRTPVNDIERMLPEEGISQISSIYGLTNAIVETLDSKRIERLNPASLYQISGGVWFGSHASEVIAVSYEHPPTFMAMLYVSIAHRAYPKTILAQLLKRLDRRQEESSRLASQINRLIDDNHTSDYAQEEKELYDQGLEELKAMMKSDGSDA